MLTKEVSQKYINDALISVHASRVKSLFETSWSLVNNANLSLTSLGRHKNGTAYVKHKIKSVDRLLGNKTLQNEAFTVYKEFFQSLLVNTPTLYIIVDWSGCCRKDVHMLRATLMHDGRGVTIYNEVHPEEKVGTKTVHNNFLCKLFKMVPLGKKVVIITDSGFITPWFKAVLKLGWDYIGRINTKINIRIDGEKKWIKSKRLDKEATKRIKYMGNCQLGMTSSTTVMGHLYTYKEKSKNRKEKSPYPDVNKRYGASAKNAWLLVTSLNHKNFNGIFIKNKYKNRMQIEQNFRDDKSARFGFGWRMGRVVETSRIIILCLIASIAAFFLLGLGVMAEKLGLHKRFQVNTVRDKRVLSLPYLGKQLILHTPPNELLENYSHAMRQLVNNCEKLLLC